MWFVAFVILSLWFEPSSVQTTPAPSPSCKVEIEPGNPQLKVGEKIELRILVRDSVDLFSAPFHLVFDPDLVAVEEVSEGDFLGGDGKRTIFLKSIQQEKGRVIVGLARLGEVGGRSGSGKLVIIKLLARKHGRSSLSFEKLDFRDFELRKIPTTAKAAIITTD